MALLGETVVGAEVAERLELEAWRDEQRVQWMTWEAEPMAASAERLAESGIGSLVFDPCANRPDKGDFLSVMRNDIRSISLPETK